MSGAPGIADLPALRDALPAAERERFDRLFEVHSRPAHLVIPGTMRAWVRGIFHAEEAVENQRVVRVTNRVTGEQTLFNTLRAARPVDVRGISMAEEVEVADLVDTEDGDPFCRPLELTPADVFGRVQGRYCITASNIAKIEAFHGVVIFDEHNPLHFTRARLADYLRTGIAWGERARKHDPSSLYWLLWWNALWKSGASIVHGHAQVVAGRGRHYAQVEHLRAASGLYRERTGRSYFADLADAHAALGLSLRRGDAVALPSLTPLKEREVWLLDRALTEPLLDLLFEVLSGLVHRVGVQSFNLVYLRPPLGPTPEDWSAFPHILRVVDRGPLTTPMSDVGGLEMFASASVASDPFRLARELGAARPAGD